MDELLAALASATELHEAMPSSRPLHEFSVDVNRRTRRERRAKLRSTPDRRAFTSEHMASPAAGPIDPRPMEPAPRHEVIRPAPIDPVMPLLPIARDGSIVLEPARPYVLPNKGVTTGTHRTLRPDLSPAPTLPFPQHALLDDPPAPQGAPTPPAAPQQPPTDAIAAVFAAAESPAAWFGGSVHVDDELMVWNSAPPVTSAAPAIAPTPAPIPVQALTAPSAPAPHASAPSRLRIVLLVAAPALLGIGIAILANQFLL